MAKPSNGRPAGAASTSSTTTAGITRALNRQPQLTFRRVGRFDAAHPDPLKHLDFVWRVNAARSHYTKSQKAAAYVGLEEFRDEKAKAKERQRAAVIKGNKTRHGKAPIPVVAATTGEAAELAAKKVHVGSKTIRQAERVKRESQICSSAAGTATAD
jgi:hypothetical protein